MSKRMVSRGAWLGLVGGALALPGLAPGLESLSAARGLTGAAAGRPAEVEPLPGSPATPLAVPADGTRPPAGPAGAPLFVLRGVRFEGGEGLSRVGLKAVCLPYLGRSMSLSDLEQLRYELTRHYVDQGYVNSGVIVKPGQVIEDGVVTFQIVTGHLTEVRISGHEGLRPGYLHDRLRPDPDEPLNREVLQRRIQFLLDDPLIERIDGTLLPGMTPGAAILDLKVVRARAWELFARVDNYHPPSTGAEFFYLGGALRNLTGFGDVLEFLGGLGLQGGDAIPERGRQVSLGWSVPVTARDTRVFVRYDRTNASLLEEPLRDLDIASNTERLEVGVSHPWWRSPRRVLNLGVLVGWSHNTTTLLGEPFSFSPGADAGESRVTAVRLFQEYLDRDSVSALGLRSVFSVGIDAFGATIHDDDLPDSRFFVWLGQAQYIRNLDRLGGTQLVLRAAVQLTPDVLLPLERYAVGGATTVRGYRENELVGDAGYVGSVEFRYPLWRSPDNLLQLALFTDFGSAWNHGYFRRRQNLFSAGAGLRWNMSDHLRAEFYLAHAFIEPLPKDTYDWQDDGIHFMIETEF